MELRPIDKSSCGHILQHVGWEVHYPTDAGGVVKQIVCPKCYHDKQMYKKAIYINRIEYTDNVFAKNFPRTRPMYGKHTVEKWENMKAKGAEDDIPPMDPRAIQNDDVVIL